MNDLEEIIKKNVTSIEWIRSEFSGMDAMACPVMGINDWDDAVCMYFSGKLIASVDGPYKKRLVMKSALIHAASDVVVKGGKPLFAMDAVTGTEDDVKDMIGSLKHQSEEMKIPILGGNTFVETTEPKCTLSVFGKLVIDEPIRDCTAQRGDALFLIGYPIWGEQDKRIDSAKKLFDAWFAILREGIRINASKDVTKGGLISTLYEISKKSGVGYLLDSKIKVSMTRNLDNFLVSVPESEKESLERICGKKKIALAEIGRMV